MNFDSTFEEQIGFGPDWLVPTFLCVKHAETVLETEIVSRTFLKHLIQRLSSEWDKIDHPDKALIDRKSLSIKGRSLPAESMSIKLVNLLKGVIGDHKPRRH
jgi:hypothetical protein